MANSTIDLRNYVDDVCRLVICRTEPADLYHLCRGAYSAIVSEIERDQLLSLHMSDANKRILTSLLLVVMLISTCGNVLVVLTFGLNKYMRSVTNVFILSLAVSDLMVTFTSIPIALGQTTSIYWKYGQFACKLIPCITHFSVACSSFTLCCIAFDRYYAIVHPLKLKFLQTTRRAAISQIVVWLVSAAFCIPYAFFYEVKDIAACRVNDEEEKLACVALSSAEETKRVFDVWITLMLLLFGPFLYMTFLYSIICYKLWVQRPVGTVTQRSNDNRFRLKRKVIKMLITVVCLFLICWSPLLLFNGIAEMKNLSTSRTRITVRAYLQCLSFSSTCWNPIVYAFMNEKFRKAFGRLLFCEREQVQPILVRRKVNHTSSESRKTVSQSERPTVPPSANTHTSETKV